MLLKSNGSLPSDSAVWYLEGLLNLENANNNHDFQNVTFLHDTLTFIASNNTLSLEYLNEIYLQINNWMTEIHNQSNNTVRDFDLVDIELEETNLKNGTQQLIVTTSLGTIGGTMNYIPFGPEDYWYWGYGLGMCGDNSGQHIGLDAATELQRKFRNPIPYPGPSYFISVVYTTVQAWQYEDLNNGFRDYMMYYADRPGLPVDDCLSPEELNYYLSKFDYIVQDNKPTGKTYKTVDVKTSILQKSSSWIHMHEYKIYYGVNTI